MHRYENYYFSKKCEETVDVRKGTGNLWKLEKEKAKVVYL